MEAVKVKVSELISRKHLQKVLEYEECDSDMIVGCT